MAAPDESGDRFVVMPGQTVRGDHHRVLGPGCTVYGDHNTVMGPGCVVRGDHNHVYGSGCVVRGNYNVAYHPSTRMTGNHNVRAGGEPRAKGSGIGAMRTVNRRGVGNPARATLAASAAVLNAASRAVVTSIGVVGNVSGSGFAISGAGRTVLASGGRIGLQVGQSIVNGGGASYTMSGGVGAGTTVLHVFAGNRRLGVKFRSPLSRFVQEDGVSTRVEWLTHDMRATRTSLRVDGRDIPLRRVFSRPAAAAAAAAATHHPGNVQMSEAALLELAKPEEEKEKEKEEEKDELRGVDEAVPEDDDDEGRACAICKENRPKVLARPCNHLVLCLHCALGLRDRTCSICRKPIKTLIAVFE